jgi:poly(A) polymerase
MELREFATSVVAKIQAIGYEAYFVGGCVRDRVLSTKDPNDYDIATSAPPEALDKLFGAKLVGKSFGVYLVSDNEHEVEVARFRIDHNEGGDGRRPASTSVAETWEEDAIRRDFTINALYQDPVNGGLKDCTGGVNDIANRLVRFVGVPHERIDEDCLRMLRAVRIAAKLRFGIETESYKAIQRNSFRLQSISPERIKMEMDKMLLTGNPSLYMNDMHELGLWTFFLPEMDRLWELPQPKEHHPEGDAYTHTMLALDFYITRRHEIGLTPDLPTLWAVLLHDIGKFHAHEIIGGRVHSHSHAEMSARMTEFICRRLKMSLDETEKIVWLVENHMRFKDIKKMRPGKIVQLLAHPFYEDLYDLCYADVDASSKNLDNLDFIEEFKKTAHIESKPTIVRLITGDDLIAEGLTPGPTFKQVLEQFELYQLENPLADRVWMLNLLHTNVKDWRNGKPESLEKICP